MQHSVTQCFAVSAEDFWQTFVLDEAYLRALYDHLALEVEANELQKRGHGSTLRAKRKLRFRARRQLPRLIKQAVGGMTTVVEELEFSAADGFAQVRVQLPVIGRRVELGGQYTWSERPGPSLERHWQGYCHARLPIVGPMLERYVLGELETSLTALQVFTDQWFAGARSTPLAH